MDDEVFGLSVLGLPGATAGPGDGFGLLGAGAFSANTLSTISRIIFLRSCTFILFLFFVYMFT